MERTKRQPHQGQEQQPQRNGPPAGWRYYAQANNHRSVLSYYSQAEPRSRLRGWLAQVWRVAKSNAALISSFIALLGVLITLVVTTVVTQQECSRQHDLEAQRAKAAREVAQQQARQEALQTYLGDMGKLILRDTSPLREADPKDEVSRLARAKTLTVLLGLDAQSKTILLSSWQKNSWCSV